MKTLDVQALRNGIDDTLEQLKKQADEIAKVKKSVDGITSLDDALKGKGGDAIRAFYEECHTPFLRFYETFIEEYQSALKKIKTSLDSFESNHNGYISQAFLEHELEQGLNAADRTTKHLVSKANATIAKVSHIADLPQLDDSDFHEQNQRAKREISSTLEKLHAFDREQTNALKTAENDLETMQRYITRLEKMYTGPKIEITGYQKGSILKPDEMDTLQPNEETPMEMMLEKLDKTRMETEIRKAEKQADAIEKLKNVATAETELDDPAKYFQDIYLKSETPFGPDLKPGEDDKEFHQTAIDIYSGSGGAIYDLAKDFYEGGKQIGWNLGWTIDHLHKDPKVVLDTVLGYDYKGALLSMVDTLAEKWDEKVVHGDAYSRAHYFTYLIGSLAGLRSGKSSVSTGSKDLAKAGKTAVGKVKEAGKTVKQSIKPPNNRYTPALQGILQDAPNSINVKNTPLVLKELAEDQKKSVLFNSSKETSGQTVKKVRKTIVPTVKSGEFNKWFNSLSTKQLDELWSDKKTRRAIERQLRAPGGMHEWHLVSRAPTFKHWGVTAEKIRELRTAINEVEFVNPTGKHGGLGSTAAHNELLKIIDSSKDYNMFVRRLNNWANYRLKGGVEALPEGLRIKK
ncbi:LXG domain-containing protein [Bacillus sp. HSf4]|uniref:ribonuclease YeeF family protein n=1 Tax=Bacillus sp. HSf4 TaxID=3035514 RepID=UPI00240A91D3|nr:LXG domain-containing protein [Bacillus sp. HSf4]WFA07021.1 LXG domain-containing protein [Bacillus sp. HSf4]